MEEFQLSPRRRKSDDFCGEHHLLLEKIDTFFKFFKETDKAHEARMGKLEEQIDRVDKKVDKLKDDLPDLVTKSVENAFKTGLWNGLKRFGKILLVIFAFTIAGALVAAVVPDFAEFLNEVADNVSSK
jgi:hypothetical protein